jgi:hypothetical protein
MVFVFDVRLELEPCPADREVCMLCPGRVEKLICGLAKGVVALD